MTLLKIISFSENKELKELFVMIEDKFYYNALEEKKSITSLYEYCHQYLNGGLSQHNELIEEIKKKVKVNFDEADIERI